MICAECPNPVHPERLAALPNAKTCSAACTRVRQLRSKSGILIQGLPEASSRAEK